MRVSSRSLVHSPHFGSTSLLGKLRLRASLFAIASFFALVDQSCFAGPWAKKDWSQWSEYDCSRVLYDSPWGQAWQDTTEYPWSRSESGSVLFVEWSWSAVLFDSALPIRLATARQVLLENNYERADPELRAAFDECVKQYLEDSYKDRIVIRYVQRGAGRGGFYEVVLRFPDGRYYVPLSRTITSSPRESVMEVVFPRAVNGESIIKPGDTTVSLASGSMQGDVFTIHREEKIQLSKLVYKGKIEF